MINSIVALLFWGFIGVILYSCHQDEVSAPAREAAQKVKDQKIAESMHISYEEYALGKEKETAAHVACRMAVENMAKYGAESDWAPNGSWTIKGRQMTILAHDVRVKNGFGAASYVKYKCLYDIDTDVAIVIDLKDY